jgi:ABC-2 type transport system permease protein
MVAKKTIVKNKIRYLDLIRELAITDFKLKYQGSVAGYLWSLAKPLMVFGVLYLVFNVFVRIGASIPHYPLYLLLGVILWGYFAEATTVGMGSVVGKGDMIRKVYFPRIVLIISSSISALITLFLNLLIVFLFMLLARLIPNPWQIFIFFVIVIELYVLTLGLSLILSSLFVKYRDIGHIWEVLIQVLFYATPIIYPLAIIPLKFQKLIMLSPISQIIQDSRWLLITNQTVTSESVLKFPLYLVPYAIPFILVIIGYFLFQKSSAKFAENV